MKLLDRLLKVTTIIYLLMYILIAPLCIYVIISSIDYLTVVCFIELTFGVLGIMHMRVTEKRKIEGLNSKKI